MITFPNAKINLGLSITEKRPDGFHNLESVFYPVSWTDILEVLPSENLHFQSSGIEIPGNPEENLCLKAYHLLKKDFDIPPIQIYLHKVIPIGAGLGGGSSDAAFTLKTINELFSLNIPNSELQNYARQLGSDCAFFIENKPLFCYEKGDRFEVINLQLTGKNSILIYPKTHISTARAYQGIQPGKSEFPIQQIIQKPISGWKDTLVNDFEKNIFKEHPALADIKIKLYELGAEYASMSGSGSTVFGIFENETDLKAYFPEEYVIWQGKFT